MACDYKFNGNRFSPKELQDVFDTEAMDNVRQARSIGTIGTESMDDVVRTKQNKTSPGHGFKYRNIDNISRSITTPRGKGNLWAKDKRKKAPEIREWSDIVPEEEIEAMENASGFTIARNIQGEPRTYRGIYEELGRRMYGEHDASDVFMEAGIDGMHNQQGQQINEKVATEESYTMFPPVFEAMALEMRQSDKFTDILNKMDRKDPDQIADVLRNNLTQEQFDSLPPNVQRHVESFVRFDYGQSQQVRYQRVSPDVNAFEMIVEMQLANTLVDSRKDQLRKIGTEVIGLPQDMVNDILDAKAKKAQRLRSEGNLAEKSRKYLTKLLRDLKSRQQTENNKENIQLIEEMMVDGYDKTAVIHDEQVKKGFEIIFENLYGRDPVRMYNEFIRPLDEMSGSGAHSDLVVRFSELVLEQMREANTLPKEEIKQQYREIIDRRSAAGRVVRSASPRYNPLFDRLEKARETVDEAITEILDNHPDIKARIERFQSRLQNLFSDIGGLVERIRGKVGGVDNHIRLSLSNKAEKLGFGDMQQKALDNLKNGKTDQDGNVLHPSMIGENISDPKDVSLSKEQFNEFVKTLIEFTGGDVAMAKSLVNQYFPNQQRQWDRRNEDGEYTGDIDKTKIITHAVEVSTNVAKGYLTKILRRMQNGDMALVEMNAEEMIGDAIMRQLIEQDVITGNFDKEYNLEQQMEEVYTTLFEQYGQGADHISNMTTNTSVVEIIQGARAAIERMGGRIHTKEINEASNLLRSLQTDLMLSEDSLTSDEDLRVTDLGAVLDPEGMAKLIQDFFRQGDQRFEGYLNSDIRNYIQNYYNIDYHTVNQIYNIVNESIAEEYEQQVRDIVEEFVGRGSVDRAQAEVLIDRILSGEFHEHNLAIAMSNHPDLSKYLAARRTYGKVYNLLRSFAMSHSREHKDAISREIDQLIEEAKIHGFYFLMKTNLDMVYNAILSSPPTITRALGGNFLMSGFAEFSRFIWKNFLSAAYEALYRMGYTRSPIIRNERHNIKVFWRMFSEFLRTHDEDSRNVFQRISQEAAAMASTAYRAAAEGKSQGIRTNIENFETKPFNREINRINRNFFRTLRNLAVGDWRDLKKQVVEEKREIAQGKLFHEYLNSSLPLWSRQTIRAATPLLLAATGAMGAFTGAYAAGIVGLGGIGGTIGSAFGAGLALYPLAARGIAVLDAVASRYLNPWKAQFHIYNELIAKDMDPRTKEFWTELNRRMGRSSDEYKKARKIARNELKRTKWDEMEGFEREVFVQRRSWEIMSEWMDSHVRREGIREAKRDMVSQTPEGRGGRLMKQTQQKAINPSKTSADDFEMGAAIGDLLKFAAFQSFILFGPVMVNLTNRTINTSVASWVVEELGGLVGVSTGGFTGRFAAAFKTEGDVLGKRKKALRFDEASKEYRWVDESRTRAEMDIFEGLTKTAIGIGLAMYLLDGWDDDEPEEMVNKGLRPASDNNIRITHDGLNLSYTQAKSRDPDWEPDMVQKWNPKRGRWESLFEANLSNLGPVGTWVGAISDRYYLTQDWKHRATPSGFQSIAQGDVSLKSIMQMTREIATDYGRKVQYQTQQSFSQAPKDIYDATAMMLGAKEEQYETQVEEKIGGIGGRFVESQVPGIMRYLSERKAIMEQEPIPRMEGTPNNIWDGMWHGFANRAYADLPYLRNKVLGDATDAFGYPYLKRPRSVVGPGDTETDESVIQKARDRNIVMDYFFNPEYNIQRPSVYYLSEWGDGGIPTFSPSSFKDLPESVVDMVTNVFKKEFREAVENKDFEDEFIRRLKGDAGEDGSVSAAQDLIEEARNKAIDRAKTKVFTETLKANGIDEFYSLRTMRIGDSGQKKWVYVRIPESQHDKMSWRDIRNTARVYNLYTQPDKEGEVSFNYYDIGGKSVYISDIHEKNIGKKYQLKSEKMKNPFSEGDTEGFIWRLSEGE